MICIIFLGKASRSYLLGDLDDLFLRKVALDRGSASLGGLCVLLGILSLIKTCEVFCPWKGLCAPVKRTYSCVLPLWEDLARLWKGLTVMFASLGGLLNAYEKDLCLPVERTYDRLWKGLCACFTSLGGTCV